MAPIFESLVIAMPPLRLAVDGRRRCRAIEALFRDVSPHFATLTSACLASRFRPPRRRYAAPRRQSFDDEAMRASSPFHYCAAFSAADWLTGHFSPSMPQASKKRGTISRAPLARASLFDVERAY